MANVVLDLPKLTLEKLPEAYEVIKKGVCERLNILRAFGKGDFTNDLKFLFADIGKPNRAQSMNQMMKIIAEMARRFVDLDPNKYIPDGGRDFPRTLIDTSQTWDHYDPNPGNSLIFPPETEEEEITNLGACVPGITSFSGGTMDEWKRMLTSAANWLNKMTAIEIPQTYYYCYRITYIKEVNDFNTTIHLEPIGTQPFGNKCIMEIEYESSAWQGSSTSPIYSSEKKRCRRITNSLEVDNRAPYDAVCKMYLCYGSSKFTLQGGTYGSRRKYGNWYQPYKWPMVNYSMQLCSGPTPLPHSDHDVPTKIERNSNAYMVQVNGEWKHYSDNKVTENYTPDANTGHNNLTSKTEEKSVINYSFDGSEQNVLEQSSESYGPDGSRYDGEPDNELEILWGTDETQVWDGLGMWSAWDQPLTEDVQAHTVKLLTTLNFDDMPEVQNIYIEQGMFPDWTRGSYNWTENFRRQWRVRVEPVFDYTDSITTYSIPSDNPEPGE